MSLTPFAFARSPAAELAVWAGLAILLGVVFLWGWAIARDSRRLGQGFSAYLGFRVLWLVCKLWHQVRPRGPDPLPVTGPAILISNHTSPADPLFLQCATRRIISFLMAREYNFKVFQPIFRLSRPILVSRSGRDTAAVKASLRALGEGRVIGIFPEGGIHLDPRTIGEGKPGVAMLALISRATVVPAFIERPLHTNQLWDGLVRPARARVVFGKPLDLSQYYGRELNPETFQHVTDEMMLAISRLRPAPKQAGLQTEL